MLRSWNFKLLQNKLNISRYLWTKQKQTRIQRGAQAVSKSADDSESLSFLKQDYNPSKIESKWYDIWLEKKYFHADSQKIIKDPSAKKFVMMLPPPNVTGSLHLGHALLLSIEDTVARWRRMSGYETLYLPGMDHAGISTQNVVENKIWKQSKLTRHDLGREKFVEEVWNWKNEYGGKILNQLKRFGASLDWDRFAFTLDEERDRELLLKHLSNFMKKAWYIEAKD